MIVLTKLDGERVALNADLIERVEDGAGTVVTMVGGSRCTVVESLNMLVDMMNELRAGVLIAATRALDEPPAARRRPVLRVLSGRPER
jgi:flagellar protein FlbD